MKWRRKSAPRHDACCATHGCGGRAKTKPGLCRRCWYQLTAGARLFIQDMVRARKFEIAHGVLHDAAHLISRRVANDRGTAPAVAMCGLCRRPAGDPVVGCCTDTQCPLARRAAA